MVDIVIDDVPALRIYIATGGQTVFNAPFYFEEATDLKVYQTPNGDLPDDSLDILILNTDYTIPAPPPYPNGTNIILTVPANAGDLITLWRDVPVERDTDFSTGGIFTAEKMNNDLNRLTLICQQLKTMINYRMLSYQRTDNVSSGLNRLQLPLPNQILQATGEVLPSGGAAALQWSTLEENPDWSTLRSQLLNNQEGTDGSRIVGYYDSAYGFETVQKQLITNINAIYPSPSNPNLIQLTLFEVTDYSQVQGKIFRLIIGPGQTTTDALQIQINSLSPLPVKVCFHDVGYLPSNIGDFFPGGKSYTIQLAGGNFIDLDERSIAPGEYKISAQHSPTPAFVYPNGEAISRTIYSRLFTLFGTYYGAGDGSTTFNVPNIISKAPVAFGNDSSGSGLTVYPLGYSAGVEQISQSIAQLANHNHILTLWPSRNLYATGGGQSAPDTDIAQNYSVSGAGSGALMENRQPFIAQSFLLKV